MSGTTLDHIAIPGPAETTVAPDQRELRYHLCASSSYIVVPAAMRTAVPEANPGLFELLSLTVTFPFNISVGIPAYWAVINHLWGTA